MKYLTDITGRACAMAGLVTTLTVTLNAAVLNVPSTEYSNLYDAIPAAQNGDEIRVANDYVETLGWITLTGKSITIRSYTPDFSSPAPGAQWDNIVAGTVNDALLTIADGGLTIEGFSMLRSPDGNVFFMTSDSSLTVRDSTFSGIGRADTAAIKTGPDAENVSVLLENTNVISNGRGIWFNQIRGNSSLVLNGCHVEDNSSYPIEWRTNRGNHQLEIRDTFYSVRNRRGTRLYTFNTTNGELGINHILVERCEFVSAPTGQYPLLLAGVVDSADPASTTTLVVRNSTFDLRQGEDVVNTVALDTLDNEARRSEVTFEHNTIVLGGENQSGIRFREIQSTCNVFNTIIDGNGAGAYALRSLRGVTYSHMNLLNVPGKSQSFLGGSVEFSGNEILDVSAGFEDIANADFRLSSTSPALGVGEEIGITDDILGNPRPSPVGTNPDLGAYEMGEKTSVADWAVY